MQLYVPKHGIMRRSGFSLLEMAIVLVIIGLLIGSIFVGRSMLQQATNRAIITEIDKFAKGVRLFSDRYKQLPGDFNGAAVLWGTDATNGCPGAFSASTVPQAATCNGDADGTIGDFDGANFTNTSEWYRAWQHMADAGVIDGQYSGVIGNVANTQVLGNSIPKSAHTSGGYTLLFRYNSAVTAEDFPFRGQHVLEYGAVDSACAGGASCITHGALLTPSDALEIDDKIDDGMPGTGIVMSHPSTSAQTPNCTTSNVVATSQYYTATPNPAAAACALIISTGF